MYSYSSTHLPAVLLNERAIVQPDEIDGATGLIHLKPVGIEPSSSSLRNHNDIHDVNADNGATTGQNRVDPSHVRIEVSEMSSNASQESHAVADAFKQIVVGACGTNQPSFAERHPFLSTVFGVSMGVLVGSVSVFGVLPVSVSVGLGVLVTKAVFSSQEDCEAWSERMGYWIKEWVVPVGFITNAFVKKTLGDPDELLRINCKTVNEFEKKYNIEAHNFSQKELINVTLPPLGLKTSRYLLPYFFPNLEEAILDGATISLADNPVKKFRPLMHDTILFRPGTGQHSEFTAILDRYFNHLNNTRSGSILSSINSIDDKYKDAKVRLMLDAIHQFNDVLAWLGNNRTATDLGDVINAFADVLLKDDTYLQDGTVRQFLIDVVLSQKITTANTVPCTFSDMELKLLLTEITQKLNEPNFITTNSGIINQLLYHAAESDDAQIRGMGDELFEAYCKKVPPELVDAYQASALVPPKFDEAYLFASSQHGMCVSKQYYEKFLLKKISDSYAHSLQWDNFTYCKKEPSSEKYVVQTKLDDLETIFADIALFQQRYQHDMQGVKFGKLLDCLELDDYFKAVFNDALKVKRIDDNNKKLVNPEFQEALIGIFDNMLMRPQKTESFDIHIKPEHLTAIYEAFGYQEQGKSGTQKAMLLFSLSAIFAKYSSSHFFGTENDSPSALRDYALALLNSAYKLDSSILPKENITDFRERFTGIRFSCTDVLSAAMIQYINQHRNEEFSKILAGMKPPLW